MVVCKRQDGEQRWRKNKGSRPVHTNCLNKKPVVVKIAVGREDSQPQDTGVIYSHVTEELKIQTACSRDLALFLAFLGCAEEAPLTDGLRRSER